MTDIAFRSLVLSGIWTIIRAVRPNRTFGYEWRANAVTYMDEHGQQTDEARKYRRDITFPE